MRMLLKQSRLAVVVIVLALAVGCGDGDGSDDDDPTPEGDAMTSETGVDAGGSDAGDVASDGDNDGEGGDKACSFFPDDCGDGKNCYTDQDGRGRLCANFNNSKSTGDSCMAENDCKDGDRCFEQTCRAMCDPDDLGEFGCRSDEVCLGLQVNGHDLEWGVCLKKEDKCTTWPNDSCGQGENCYGLPTGLRCRAYDGNAKAGDSCSGSTECNDDQVCVGIEEGENHCRDKCDMDHPCDSGSCEEITDLNFGACIPDQMGG